MPEHRANTPPTPSGRQPIGGDALRARVVVVGRTGLDARLRLDPAIELIRARTGFDAIGELANPIGEVPRRTVVLVGTGAEIDDRNGGGSAFVAAVRRVAPDAYVAACGDADANTADAGAYDSVVAPSATSDELRELIHGTDATPPAHERPPKPGDEPDSGADEGSDSEPARAPDRDPGTPIFASPPLPPPPPTTPPNSPSSPSSLDVSEIAVLRGDGAAEVEPVVDGSPASRTSIVEDRGDEPAPFEPGAACEMSDMGDVRDAPASISAGADRGSDELASGSGSGDDVLVAAALGGRDVLEPAMGLVRARLGRSDVEFVPQDGADAVAGGAAEVEWGGRRFGVLVLGRGGPSIDPVDGGSAASPAAGPLGAQARWLGSWLALAEQQRRLRLEAYTDAVSGAWNRRYFDRFLDAAIPHARERRHNLTVLVFDIDNFKSFNDRFGHEAGDMILSETVRLLRSMTRPSDRICRIGGDEFAVIFYDPEGPRDSNSDHPDAFEAVAGRFQRAVEDQRFPKLGIGAPGELTISGGLATFPWDGQSAGELLGRADELAIESKRAGKNQITFGPRGGPSLNSNGGPAPA